jgi:hypothetical protein
MKAPLVWSLAALLATALMLPSASAQSTVQSKYNEGVLLYNAGKYGEALIIFEEVLAQKPDFIYARNYSAKAKSMIAKGAGPKNDLEGKLARIIVPEINFADAPLGDVLDYFSARSTELSGGTLAANFIYKGTPEQRMNTLVTLSLRAIPLTEAIKYVAQLSNSKVKYEEHAVVIEPNQSSQPAQTTSAPAPATSTGTTFE